MFGRRQSLAQKVVAFPEATNKDTLADWRPVTDLSYARVSEKSENETVEQLVELAGSAIAERIHGLEGATMDRSLLADRIGKIIDEMASEAEVTVEEHNRRDAVTVLLNDFLSNVRRNHPDIAPALAPTIGANTCRNSIIAAKDRIQPILMEQIDLAKASALPRSELAQQIGELVGEILAEERMQINQLEQRDLITSLLNDMLGLGPLEPLLADDKVTDIMVNGPKQVYVERGGKLELSGVSFADDNHVMNIATRIVTQVGRRIDESTPLVDARLADGSRVNIIVPPLAIDGPSISIRKFAKQKITLDVMERQRNLSPEMAKVLKIASRCRLNILISGGTGSGKTTLLNALSRMIDHGERIVTIEDAAELQLQQPHVVR
ncbi:MAG: Flp pilus assembly complex ATPase component TadA, partial [Rhodospirillales bacterium]|nr:Flp pilus assembly complex ATPase component TadA [Rhodospirillales bacterium]